MHKSEPETGSLCTMTPAVLFARLDQRDGEKRKPIMSTIDEHTRVQVVQANASGRTPVVFVHGLWLLASSWDRWARAVRARRATRR